MSSDRTVSERMPLVDALRAVAATLIVWHHFALYWPHEDLSAARPGALGDWLWNFRWAVQVFFVLGGYLMAMNLARCAALGQPLRRVVLRRYLRLGMPYAAAIALAILACAWGRGWLSEEIVGAPPKLGQVLAHLFFLQDILGYESLAAGAWFLCIDFQLALMWIALVYVGRTIEHWLGRSGYRPRVDVSLVLGGALALASVCFFNLEPRYDVWAVYFFGHFFMGVLVYYALADARLQGLLVAYALVLVAALAYDWRGHLAVSLVTGLALFMAGKQGLLDRWPTSRWIGYQGRTSYSLFLLHFPVLVVVAACWARFEWDWRGSTLVALVLAYLLSVLVAAGFHHAVEAPAARLARKFG